jgi:uncharacterized membrane protein YcaP (DUF421 family)
MDINDLMLTAVRATIIYFFVLFVVRLLGKREIGNLGPFDLIVSLMIGEVVDEAIYGDVSLIQGFIAIGTVAIWHMVNSWAGFKSKTIDKLTEASPRVIVEDGKINRDALASERLSEEELFSQLRLKEIEDLAEVKRATLEPDGQISVIQQDWARPLQKGDLKRLKDRAA